ncbi:MAG: hypothetical protein JWP15_2183, partial [Alphaproteobacteria bacterium]|nr:hypothetical protein [Alphaproteobacteria bacterium]
TLVLVFSRRRAPKREPELTPATV